MEYGSLWNRGSPTLRGQYMTAPGAEVLSADSVELVCWKTVLKLLWGNTVFHLLCSHSDSKHCVQHSKAAHQSTLQHTKNCAMSVQRRK